MKNIHNDEIHSLYSSPNIVRWLNQGEWVGRDMWHA